jgi:PilZ domain-containing protein
MRVYGQLVPIGAPIVILNLSRHGFAVVSRLAFEPGATLDFRLIAETGVRVRVTAEAVHTRPHPSTPGQYVTGFKFVPGRLTGIVPMAAIDQLIDAVMPAGSLLAT